MKRFMILAAAMGVAGWIGGNAHAASVSFTKTVRPFIPDPVLGGPTLGPIRSYYLTSDADVLSILSVRASIWPSGVLFQVDPPFGSNTEPPNPVFVALNRALAYDCWITTPGSTTLTGADLPGDGTGAWSDTTNDGPQIEFQFAQLSSRPDAYISFSGVVRVAGEQGPEDFPFSFEEIPEPAGATLAALALGLLVILTACPRQRSSAHA
jgi:hypothetical protein